MTWPRFLAIVCGGTSLGTVGALGIFVVIGTFASLDQEARCRSIAGLGATHAHVHHDVCLWRDASGAWHYRQLAHAGEPQPKLADTGIITEDTP